MPKFNAEEAYKIIYSAGTVKYNGNSVYPTRKEEGHKNYKRGPVTSVMGVITAGKKEQSLSITIPGLILLFLFL